MRTKLLLSVFLVLFAVSVLSAERIELTSSGQDVNVTVLESNDYRTLVKFEIGAYHQKMIDINGDSYYQVSLPGEAIMLDEGAPDLPRLSRSIIIPDDAQMDVNVSESQYIDVDHTPVAPSKGNLLRTVNPDDVPYPFGDVYQSDSWYPRELASIREPFIMRDYRGTVIDLNAFQYHPQRQTLRVFTSVTVEVKNVGMGQVNILENADRTHVVPDFENIYKRRFINFDHMMGKYTMLPQEGEMLVISHGTYMTVMQPFVDWKLQKGIKTTLVDVATIGANVTSISNFIDDFEDTTDLAFVLLVGDYIHVPTPSASGGASDPSYGKVIGTDDYPDVIIGRFSAETIADVETQVDRTIYHELNVTSGDWLHKGMGVASTQGAGTGHYGESDDEHMGYIRDDLLAFTFTEVDEFYGSSASDAMVSASLNEGRSFINYCGHGSTTSWSTTGFNNSDINALTNDNMLPFIVSVACVNGDFDGPTCFAEAWMRAQNNGNPTGAMGIYASSINQSWAPPMYAEDEVTDLLVAGTMWTFGANCFNGSAYMMEQVGAVDMSDTWHIFGDPSALMRTDDPDPMTVNYTGAVFFNVPSFDVEVVGVEDALCALYHDGVLYGSAYTDATGNATINLDQALPIGMQVTLTVTAFNKETFVGSVQTTSDLAIVHSGLPDTKDTLNDYEVIAELYSSADFIPDSILLHYEINSVWTTVQMIEQRIVEGTFQAFIPAQQAGTYVNYYMTAKNQDTFYDTTETFSFKVIDYGVMLEPENMAQTAPALDTVWYDLKVTNDGVLADDYSLTIENDVYDSKVFDASGASEISSTGTLYMGNYLDFKVRVIIPSSYEGEFDDIMVLATSTENSSYADTSYITTTSAGQPWEIPFTDIFATTSFEIAKWESWDEAEINDLGIGELSAPYSANLNGESTGGDVLITEAINLRDESNIVIKYAYQQTGGGESPDANDDLIIEYLADDSSWVELNRHLGADADMTEFEEVEIALPMDGMHAGFRLKIRCTATAGAYDDWFVDDIYVGHPSDFDVRVNPAMQSQYGPAGGNAAFTLTVVNRGYLDDNFNLTSDGNWTVEFFDASGVNPITATGNIAGGDSVDVVARVTVPAGTPLHDAEMMTAYATSQGDPNISAYAMIEAVSAGEPAPVPWSESFPDDTLHIQKWFDYIGVSITTAGQNPPSDPYSIRFDGGVDTAATQLIDLDGQSGVLLSYYYQLGGMSDKPEAGDNLWIEYRNSAGNWVNLVTHDGADTAMQMFEYNSVELPADAHHESLQIRFRSYGEAAGMDNWYVDDIRIDFPPAMACNVSSFNETLVQGDSSVAQLIIDNSGQGTLIYDLALVPHLRADNGLFAAMTDNSKVAPASQQYPEELYTPGDLPKGEDDGYEGMPMRFDMGGPDNYGYYWTDSDEPNGPTFDWIDISGIGTDIMVTDPLSDDSYSGPHDLEFSFPYYGTLYDQVYIGSNGIIGFTADNMDARSPKPIPSFYTPNAILALLWDDLNPADGDNPGAKVYYHSNSERTVISFVDYPEYRADPGDVFTAQVILRPDGTVKFQYQTIATGFDINNCAVGIENSDGTDGLGVAYQSPGYLQDGLAIEFFKPYDWLLIDKFSGELTTGQADTITCNFVTSLDFDPGIYTADLVINCNDPANDPMTIGAQLEVVEYQPYICGDANGDETVDVSDAVLIVNYAFGGGNPPDPIESGDANCDVAVDVSDAVTIINFAFAGGNAPCDTDGDGEPDC